MPLSALLEGEFFNRYIKTGTALSLAVQKIIFHTCVVSFFVSPVDLVFAIIKVMS